MKKLTKQFKVFKSIIDSSTNFNGYRIDHDITVNIILNMKDYLSIIKPRKMSIMGRKESDQKASTTEYDSYISLAGNVMCSGNGPLPKSIFRCFQLTTNGINTQCTRRTSGQKTLKALKYMEPIIEFNKMEKGSNEIKNGHSPMHPSTSARERIPGKPE